MTTLLRWVRGLFGLLAAFQVTGLLPVLTWMAAPSNIQGKWMAMVFVKVLTLVICVAIYNGMRSAINRRAPADQPILKSAWSL